MEEQNRLRQGISEEMLELKEFRDEMREENRYEDEEISKFQAEINEELYRFKAEIKEEVAQFRAQHNEEMADIRSKLNRIMDLLGLDTTAAGNPVDDKMLEDTKLIDSEEIKGDDSAIKFVEDGNNFTEMLLLKSVGKDEGIGLNEGNVVDGVVVLSLIDLQPALGSLGDTTVNGSSNGSTKAWFEGAMLIIEVVLGQNAIDDVAHKVFDEMFQSIRAVLTDEHVIDPYASGFNFNNITLFDPGGDRKYATSYVEVLDPIRGVKKFSLYSALCEPSTNVSDNEYPSHKPHQYPSIVGVVNGLVCLDIEADGLFLWNPVLRKSKLLPSVNFTQNSYLYVAHGFGYDESHDDYKVVFVVTVYPFRSNNENELKVYSLRTDSWRRIENFMCWLPLGGLGKYANGKIHWAAGSSAWEWKIVSLDMASEKYGELQRPDYEAGVSGWVFGVSGGQLFVLCDYDKKKADLWVMDKYGVQESWTKVVSIPYDNVHPAKPYSLHRVVCILQNGDIVLSDGSDLLVYHSKRKEFRNIELGGCKQCYFNVYVESLVSPIGSGV